MTKTTVTEDQAFAALDDLMTVALHIKNERDALLEALEEMLANYAAMHYHTGEDWECVPRLTALARAVRGAKIAKAKGAA